MDEQIRAKNPLAQALSVRNENAIKRRVAEIKIVNELNKENVSKARVVGLDPRRMLAANFGRNQAENLTKFFEEHKTKALAINEKMERGEKLSRREENFIYREIRSETTRNKNLGLLLYIGQERRQRALALRGYKELDALRKERDNSFRPDKGEMHSKIIVHDIRMARRIIVRSALDDRDAMDNISKECMKNAELQKALLTRQLMGGRAYYDGRSNRARSAYAHHLATRYMRLIEKVGFENIQPETKELMEKKAEQMNRFFRRVLYGDVKEFNTTVEQYADAVNVSYSPANPNKIEVASISSRSADTSIANENDRQNERVPEKTADKQKVEQADKKRYPSFRERAQMAEKKKEEVSRDTKSETKDKSAKSKKGVIVK